MSVKRSRTFVRWLSLLFAAILIAAFFLSGRDLLSAANNDDGIITTSMQRILAEEQEPGELGPLGATPCVGGFAGIYPCNNVDLLSVTPHSSLGGTGLGNDIWGWTDPLDGNEYALVGQSNGVAFVDVTDPVNPLYLGRVNSHTGNSSTWRDVKVYANHAFIVSDGNSGHGMQVFDLTELRNVPSPPVVFPETAWYGGVSSAHNVAINEDTGYAYIVGGSACSGSGGLEFVDISTPTSPTYDGCFGADGYTHDVQCVIYNGPDTNYQGSEICFASNEDTFTIVDVTNKNSPVQLSRTGYAGEGYTHQGWLTEDQAYFLLGDELDELNFGNNTTTYLWDLADLTAPVNYANYVAGLPTIDHNLYTRDGYAYESNYTSGLRILNLSDLANGNLVEDAFFDTYPGSNSVSFSGQWSNYPYFESGNIIANDRNNGLFVLKAVLTPPDYNALLGNSAEADNPGSTVTHTLTLSNTGTLNDSYNLSIDAGSWSTILLTGTPVGVNAGATADIEVSVDIPAGTTLGQTDVFTLTATSVNDPGLSRTGNGTTTVTGNADITSSGNITGTGEIGNAVNYTLTFTNSGDISDTFSLSLSGNTWNTQLSTPAVGPLAPGASADVMVTVYVGSGSSDIADVMATSYFDGSVTESLMIETFSQNPPPEEDLFFYIPIVLSQP